MSLPPAPILIIALMDLPLKPGEEHMKTSQAAEIYQRAPCLSGPEARTKCAAVAGAQTLRAMNWLQLIRFTGSFFTDSSGLPFFGVRNAM